MRKDGSGWTVEHGNTRTGISVSQIMIQALIVWLWCLVGRGVLMIVRTLHTSSVSNIQSEYQGITDWCSGKPPSKKQSLHFWWNQTFDNRDRPGFKLNWEIENGHMPDVMVTVSRDLRGSVSTPGLGSLAPPNYFEERHEYTAVIELPNNITDVIGNSSLKINVDVTFPDNMPDGDTEKFASQFELSLNYVTLTWYNAEAFCVSKGGDLASASSPDHWFMLKDFIARSGMKTDIWIGGKFNLTEGKWTWSDGSTWLEEHWESGRPVGRQFLYVNNDKWYDDSDNWLLPSICMLPINDNVPDHQDQSEVELLTGEPKLEYNNMKLSWSTAQKFCVSKGGHLASVASPYHLIKLDAFIANDNGRNKSVWLGGTNVARQGEGVWTDGSKWNYYLPSYGSSEKCLDIYDSDLYYDDCNNEYPSVCSFTTRIALTSDTQLVFTSENISTPAIQFRWVAQQRSEKKEENRELAVMENDLRRNKTMRIANLIGGFKLSWQLEGSANVKDGDNKSNHVWKIDHASSEKDLNMATIMNLVRESKIHRIREREVWKTLLKHRWNSALLEPFTCLTEKQVAWMIYKTGKELNLKYARNIWIPEEDLGFGTQLYSIFQCSRQLIEAAKLSALFESLLTDHNLNTVVAATVHNIQPRAGDNIKDFTAINMWYERLDERYNFSLRSNILPLLTTENLEKLETINPPYMKELEARLNDTQYDNISTHLGNKI